MGIDIAPCCRLSSAIEAKLAEKRRGFVDCAAPLFAEGSYRRRLLVERQRRRGSEHGCGQIGWSSFSAFPSVEGVNMQRDWIGDLVAQLRGGAISRRDFAKRAAAIGISATLINQAINAAAQDATPAAIGDKASDIGQQDIEHVTDTSQGTIKLYSSWPLTGSSEQIGGDAVQAVKLALEDFGSAAGGFALSYEAMDDGIAANNGSWDGPTEADNATKVVNDPDAMVYMATYNSGAAQISIPITNEAGMAQISYANTYVGLTRALDGVTEEGEPDKFYPTGKRNYMRTVVADDIQGTAAANWAYNENGNRKAYVLHDNQPYGKGVAGVFRLEFEKLGGEVLGFEGYVPDAGDYQSLMSGIADQGPDIVYLGAIVNLNASKLLQDLRDFMPADQVTFLGPDGLINQDFVDGAGEAAEGAYITFGGVPAGNLAGPGADYAARMQEVLGHAPDAYATYAYETTVVVIQAIDKAAVKDRAAILDAMFATKDFYSLLGGTWSFTENGDTDSTRMGLNQIQGGQIVYVKAIG
jgi:branched-chain amino acid transport system substrate-binding protein